MKSENGKLEEDLKTEEKRNKKLFHP